MTKKDFIALADAIVAFNREQLSREDSGNACPFTEEQLECLAGVLQAINPRFNDARWINYIRGECGPNGGKL